MATLNLEFSGFKNCPYVRLDGREIKFCSLKKCTIDVSHGEHEIFVCEKKYVFRWYWWVQLFNIYYMISLLKQYQGNSLGYDGECVFALFSVICSDDNTTIQIKRDTVSWERTKMSADYTKLTIISSKEILMKSCELNSDVCFRLKFNKISPLVLLTFIYNIIFIIGLLQNSMPLWEVLLGIAVDCYVVGFTIYKMYKAIVQKSFSQSCNISRVNIKNNLKNTKT